jgi:hypothetical protein
MSASDHFIDAYVAGLDLVPVEMAITAAGAAIGAPPIAGAIQSQSAVLYCMRHANVERLMARVRGIVPANVEKREAALLALSR